MVCTYGFVQLQRTTASVDGGGVMVVECVYACVVCGRETGVVLVCGGCECVEGVVCVESMVYVVERGRCRREGVGVRCVRG